MILCFDESLREYFPERVEVQASSPLEALRLIAEQHPLNGKIERIPIKFKDNIDYEAITQGNQQNTFTLTRTDVPPEASIIQRRVYSGASGKVLGAVLVVVGVALLVVTWGAASPLSGALIGAGLSAGVASALVTAASILGSVALGFGLQMLLAPKAKALDAGTRFGSYTFGAGVNTTEVGTTIPLIFGRCLASAQILSFNISTNSNFNGMDDPDGSPYFKSKSDTNLPTINNNKFYGLIRAGDQTKILHQDATVYRTGTEIQ